VKNIDSNIIAMGWVSFFTDMASSMVTTLLPIFVVYVLDESVEKLGYIIAIATFVSYALRIVFGYLSERYGIVKPFILFGYLLSAITKPLLGFANSYGDVAALRSFERVGKAMRSASKDALISYYSQKKAEGKSFGLHKMMDVSGEMFGSVIIVMLFLSVSLDDSLLIRHIFEWTLLPGMLGVLIILFFVKDMKKPPKSHKLVIVKADYRLLWMLGSYFLFLLFFMSDQYFILHAKSLGMTMVEIPLLVIVSTLTQAVLSYYSGLIIDKTGSKSVLFIASVFGILSLLALKNNFIWMAFVLFGIFNVTSLNAMRTYIAVNALSKAFVYGVFYAGIAVFSALGALIVGFIWGDYGFVYAVDFSLGGSFLISMGLFFVLLKDYYKRSSKLK